MVYGLNSKRFFCLPKSAFLSLMVLGFNATEVAPPVYAATSQSVAADVAANLRETSQLNVNIGFFDKAKATFVLKVPSEQAYGFAGKPATPAQQEKVDEVLTGLRENIASMISLDDKSLVCKYEVNDIASFRPENETKVARDKEKKTTVKTDFLVLRADVTLKCDKELLGKQVTVDLSRVFKNTNKVVVDLNSTQKMKFTLDSKPGTFRM